MEKRVKDDILTILRGVLETLKVREPKDIQELRILSDHTIHDASIYQDEYSVEIAIAVYSLYKLLERGCECTPGQYSQLVKNFKQAKQGLEADNYALFKTSISSIFKTLHSLDEKLKLYVQEVIRKAKITKGSKLFAHGLSVATAAKIMDISQWELNNYIGKTVILEGEKGGMSQPKRFARALQLFNL